MPTNRLSVLCRYLYDPLDRLVECAPSEHVSTQRFYLKDRLTSETQGAVRRSIVQHEDQLLAQQQRRNEAIETSLLATDQQRSVLNLLTAAGLHPLSYTPYGHRPSENGLLSLLGFNGERPDPVTGCYLLGNGYRAFNPVLMRFNSPDSWSPFGEGGLNAYAYCVGDPVNRMDPTGHAPPFFGKLLGFLDNIKISSGTKTPATELTRRGSIPSNSNFLGEIFKTAEQSLRRNSTILYPSFSAPRQHIKNAVDAISNPDPFIKRLGDVNSNLASHGNTTLPMDHALKYENLVKQVSEGNLSNTGAHVESAIMWTNKYMKDRRPSGVVGVIFNGIGGTLLSGTHDHALQKTGAALRQSSR